MLEISVGTVRKHVEHILGALRLPTRTAAAACYLRAQPSVRTARWSAEVSGIIPAEG